MADHMFMKFGVDNMSVWKLLDHSIMYARWRQRVPTSLVKNSIVYIPLKITIAVVRAVMVAS